MPIHHRLRNRTSDNYPFIVDPDTPFAYYGITSGRVTESIYDGIWRGPKSLRPWLPCFHFKSKPFQADFHHLYGTVHRHTAWCHSTTEANLIAIALGQSADEIIQRESVKLTQLDFQRNNSFNAIVALFELDELISSLLNPLQLVNSYGGITWGLMPLISDLKSLYNSVVDLATSAFSQLDGQTVDVVSGISANATFPYTGDLFTATGKMRISGKLKVDNPLSDLDTALRIFADELGLHFNPSTLWNAIPFSFAVDYFLPIGDLLESLHPSGWFRPHVIFEGGYSYKVTAVGRANNHNGGWRSYNEGSMEIYSRSALTIDSKQVTPYIDWQSPSPREWFNTSYLAASSVKNRQLQAVMEALGYAQLLP